VRIREWAMAEIKDTVFIRIEYFDGQEEGDIGHPYYVASSDELHFTTDGESFEEMLSNVRECLDLALEDTDSIREYGVSPKAKVKLIMELPEHA
jgi:predicted RNase H-like HicB family nuclease